MNRSALVAVFAACGWWGAAASAGEPAKAPEPPKIVAPTADEIKAELDKETPEQKALRAELAALAKKGQKIYFNANLGEKNRNEVFAMDPDGANVKQLTKEGGDYPHCSPDGKRVAFCSVRIPVKEPLPEALKSLPIDAKFPLFDWGKFSAWNRANGPVIWMMNADGSDPQPAAIGCMPHWSHDGKFLCYNVVHPPFPCQLVILDLEKKVETGISHPSLRNCGFPCFSPDDQYVVGSNGSAFCVKLNAEKNAVDKLFQFDNGHPCNGELSPDGKTWVYVVDTNKCLGGWLCLRPMDYEKPGPGGANLPLGWKESTVNYYPDFSPDGKYLVYAHAEQQTGVNSWELKTNLELYVTRLPKCEATVRITWNGAANQHPHWWGPK
jgi:Tol biopolymer transport system component